MAAEWRGHGAQPGGGNGGRSHAAPREGKRGEAERVEWELQSEREMARGVRRGRGVAGGVGARAWGHGGRGDSLRSWAPRGRPTGLMGGGREDGRWGPQPEKKMIKEIDFFPRFDYPLTLT